MIHKLAKRFLHIGQTIPQLKLVVVSGNSERYNIERDVDSIAFFSNKKIVLVGFPGAFTPTCTGNHIPEFIKLHAEFKAKGAEVVGLAVNDPFVMKEFGEELKGSIPYICDGTGTLTKALDAGIDLSGGALGYRTRRFTLLVDNGTITQVNDEKSGGFTDVSKAETILRTL